LTWGSHWSGQLRVPANLGRVVAIDAGKHHSLAVQEDGNVVCWGDNLLGQCQPPDGLRGVRAVAGGGTHSLALMDEGRVLGWGAGSGNDVGQIDIPAAATDVVAIAAGDLHSLALRADGSLLAWGWNGFGQTDVPAGYGLFTAISGGAVASFGLTPLPVLTSMPKSQTVLAGFEVRLSATAVSGEPVAYPRHPDNGWPSQGRPPESEAPCVRAMHQSIVICGFMMGHPLKV
jgi:alpha-tubulin suppressor-like RCC1 family protein